MRAIMSINRKLLFSLTMIWISILIIMLVGVRYVLVESILNIENGHINRNVARVHNAINQELQSLSSFTVDWAHWNDAYDYVEGNNPQFVINNIDIIALTNSRINLMIYYNSKKEILIGTYINPQSNKFTAYPRGLEKYISPGSRFLNTVSLNTSTQGLVLASTGIMLMVSAGTSNTDISKPVNGILLTGRNLSDSFMDKLSKTVEMNLKLYLPSAITANSTLTGYFHHALASANGNYILLPNNNDSYAYTILRDINNKPIGMIKAYMPRDVFAGGYKAIQYFLIIFAAIFLVSSVILWKFLREIIISRLEQLNNDILNISNKQDYRHSIRVQGTDELSSVGHQINNMLAIIEKTQTNLKSINDELHIKTEKLHLQNTEMDTLIKSLKESESRFRESFDNAAIGVCLVGIDGNFIKVNKSLCKLAGYSEAEFLNKNSASIIFNEDAKRHLDYMKKMLNATINTYQMEMRYIKKSGELIWVLLSCSLIRDADTGAPLYFVEQIQDIDARKKAEAQLKEMAYHDVLTGLANRKLLQISFDTMSNHAKRYNKKMAVLFIDLDYFKEVNDQFGHEIGDIVLKIVSTRLQMNARLTDIIARLGGDEFVIVITEVSAIEAISTVLNKMHRVLSEPYIINDQAITISASVGVSIFPEDGSDLITLMRCADKALYVAKEKSRGSHQFYHQQRSQDD